MAVRNFWIVIDVDGRKEKIMCGPRNKEGGFDLTVYHRVDGRSEEAVEILGRADMNGELTLRVNVINYTAKRFEIKSHR